MEQGPSCFVYPYRLHSDQPAPGGTIEVLYNRPLHITQVSSLKGLDVEGVFITEHCINHKKDKLLCHRSEMNGFEERYQGKFAEFLLREEEIGTYEENASETPGRLLKQDSLDELIQYRDKISQK